MHKVFIYDPNWINPYGVELAAIISSTGRAVELWCTANRDEVIEGVSIRAKLQAGSRTSAGSTARLIFNRLYAPFRVILGAPLRQPLIVVWTRDPWDGFLFGARAAIGGKTVFIYHNPAKVRPRRGLAGGLERLLVRLSTLCVVHSPRLASACKDQSRAAEVRVASHPPYQVTTSKHRIEGASDPGLPTVAFVGALRPDKGADDLIAIAEGVSRPWRLRVLGPDRLPPKIEKPLTDSHVVCEYIGSENGPTDAELVFGLQECNLMIAPYRSVTESGSIHLALSLDVPVLAYESPGVSHILNSRSMAAGPTQLGRKLSSFFESAWETFTPHAAELHKACSDDWERILNEIN